MCEFVHSNTLRQREFNICVRSEVRVCALLMSARTNLLTARVSLRPLTLKYLNFLHEFSLNTDINVCCSGLTCARALSAPGWWRNKCSYSSIRHSHWTRVNGLSIADVVMYWEARMRIHKQKHTLAEPCFFTCYL